MIIYAETKRQFLEDVDLNRIERRLADSVANPDAVRPWDDIESEALARAKR